MSFEGLDLGRIGVAFGAELLFGTGYAWITNEMRKAKMLDEGWSAILVVFGVAGCIAVGVLTGVLSIETALILFILFAGCGLMMVITAIVPIIQHNHEEIKKAREHKD